VAIGHDQILGNDLHRPKLRQITGSPVGSATPSYVDELVIDTTTDRLWRATGLTPSDWRRQLGVRPLADLYSMPTCGGEILAPGDASAWLYPNVSAFQWSMQAADSLSRGTILDTATSKHMAWTGISKNDDEPIATLPTSFRLHYRLPENFRAWKASGIRLATMFQGNAGSAALAATFQLEVMAPATGASFGGGGAVVTRTVAPTTIETAFTYLDLTPTIFGAESFRPLDPIVLEVSIGVGTAGAALAISYFVGQLQILQGG